MSKKQELALILVLLMTSLGIFGFHKPAKTERHAGHEHVENYKPSQAAIRRGIGVDSGASAGVTRPPSFFRALGLVLVSPHE